MVPISLADLVAAAQAQPTQQTAGDVVGWPEMRRGVPRATDYSRKMDEQLRLKALQGVPAPGNDNSNIAPLPIPLADLFGR